MVFIYRQEILQDISLFTSQPKIKFYDELFLNLDLFFIPANNSKTGRKGYSNQSMICAFIVMKCEGFSQISDLHDYLSNNLIIAHFCGFDITKELPSYAKFTRFIRKCPCNHKCWNNGKKTHGCTKYVTIPDDYRLSIDRNSIAFKSVYALRTEAERYNSRFKQSGCERVYVRNGNSVKNLNTMAHITLLSVAITAVVTKKNVSYRSVKSVKRLA